MHVFVTGGCGFIGYHTLRALVSQGHRVTVYDDLSTGKLENVSDLLLEFNGRIRAGVVKGKIEDFDSLQEAMIGCDAVINLAALVSVPLSIEDPRKSFTSNALGFFNVLEAARLNGIKRVVYASSAAVYGNGQTDVPYWDSPLSPYGADKLVNDVYGNIYRDLYKMEVIGLRYFNVYGPRQDPASQYAGVISKFIDRAISGEKVTIFGDGEQSRSFIYVDDVARINALAATTNTFKQPGVYNLAHPGEDSSSFLHSTDISLNSLLDVLEKIFQKKIEREHLPARQGDILSSRADIFSFLWACQLPEKFFTSLEDGLRMTVQSLQDSK